MEELLDNSSIEQIKQFIINNTNNETDTFKLLCKNGHLEVAKWLLGIKPDIDISSENNMLFQKLVKMDI